MKVFWCSVCKVPVINKEECCGKKTRYMSTDIRPVFPEERYLIKYLMEKTYKIDCNNKYKEFLDKIDDFMWAAGGYRYFCKGKAYKLPFNKIKKLFEENKELMFEISEELRNLSLNKNGEEYRKFNVEIKRFIEVNKRHLKEIEYAALNFVKRAVQKYPESQFLPVVSFSGGKDSTVVSHIVRRALSNPSILHLFSDTTLEYESTYVYLNRFRKKNSHVPFFITRSKHDFKELCRDMGPPSRVMSWCCTIFKTGPLNNKINSFTKNKLKLLTFYGIRRSESPTRSGYQKVELNEFDNIKKTDIVNSPKIAQQKVTSPIFDWADIDIWLYILGNDLDFNDAYRKGYTRVGCWCCPSNSKWSEFLAKIYMPKESSEWENFLFNFAQKIGKKDPEVYVRDGKWKARQGGAGLDNKQIQIEVKPCVDEEFSKTYILTRPITEELYEYFKPFGLISKDLGRKLLNEVVILDRLTKKPLIKLQGKLKTYNLKVVAVNPDNYRLLSQRINCQLRKYQSCIGCLGCVSICPHGAISYINGKYKISEKKCKGCMECISPWSGGCLITKVLAVRKGE